jgi:hypothetical protein
MVDTVACGNSRLSSLLMPKTATSMSDKNGLVIKKCRVNIVHCPYTICNVHNIQDTFILTQFIINILQFCNVIKNTDISRGILDYTIDRTDLT